MSQAVLAFVLDKGRVSNKKIRPTRIVRPMQGALTPSEAARVLGVGVEFMRSKAVDPDYGFTVLLGQDRNKFFFKPAAELIEEARRIPEFMLKYGDRIKPAKIHQFTSSNPKKEKLENWMSLQEAAVYLKLPETALRHDRITGKYGIPVHKLPGGKNARLYYIKSELYRWRKKNGHLCGLKPKARKTSSENARRKKLFWKMLDMIL